jgi:hypothetical protein
LQQVIRTGLETSIHYRRTAGAGRKKLRDVEIANEFLVRSGAAGGAEAAKSRLQRAFGAELFLPPSWTGFDLHALNPWRKNKSGISEHPLLLEGRSEGEHVQRIRQAIQRLATRDEKKPRGILMATAAR